jgi:hypothetical protein
MVQWIGRSMGRGVRPSGNVSKPLPPPADPNGGAPGMERTMTCALTVWLAGSSIGAVATRSVVSGGDPPVDSAAGIEGDGNEGSGVAARAVGQATALRRGRRGGRRRQARFRRTAL